MKGRIIKGIAGFYYVQTGPEQVYECRAKGIFRKEKQKPLVGDLVEISVIDEAEHEGNLDVIYPRRNALVRPAVANVDQVLVIFALSEPKPNLNLLDRFLVAMEKQGVSSVICFNKLDTVSEQAQEKIAGVYAHCGYPVLFASARRREGISEVLQVLQGKTTAVAGPSGVGKSSMVNLLAPEAAMETGEISRKIDRGRHTTRHSEILSIGPDTWICDTPGFSSLMVWDMAKEELQQYFREFAPYQGQCRFLGCSHTHEPGCRVKQACEEGKICPERYGHYVEFYTELKEKEKRRY